MRWLVLVAALLCAGCSTTTTTPRVVVPAVPAAPIVPPAAPVVVAPVVAAPQKCAPLSLMVSRSPDGQTVISGKDQSLVWPEGSFAVADMSARLCAKDFSCRWVPI